MKQYVDLLKKVLGEGDDRHDRTGVGTKSIFGGQIEFDLRESFPLVTIKKTLWKSAFVEMLWFLRGEPNTAYLKEHGVKIWDDWADEQGNLGPVYGVQWRSWPGKLHYVPLSEVYKVTNTKSEHKLSDVVKFEHLIGQAEHRAPNGDPVYIYQDRVDQLKDLLMRMQVLPNGRRHIVTAWNPGYISDMGLPPCHRDFQCYVSNDGHIDLMMAQRSWDLGLGAPFNIAQYAMLTHLIAFALNKKPRKLIINYGDAHVYLNHVEPLTKMLDELKPLDPTAQLVINQEGKKRGYYDGSLVTNGYSIDDFDIVGYESHPFIKLPIAV